MVVTKAISKTFNLEKVPPDIDNNVVCSLPTLIHSCFIAVCHLYCWCYGSWQSHRHRHCLLQGGNGVVLLVAACSMQSAGEIHFGNECLHSENKVLLH